MEYGNIEGQGTITPLPSDFSISGQSTGDIVYFDGANWVRLPAGTDTYHLRANGASAPTWEVVANPLPTDLNLTSQATGTICYYDGANWVVLSAGTSTYLLQANGAAAPTWVAPPSGASGSGVASFLVTGGSGSSTSGVVTMSSYTAEVFDTGGNFSGSNFTAPSTGIYLFNGIVGVNCSGGSGPAMAISMVNAGGSNYSLISGTKVSGNMGTGGSIVVSLTSGQTAYFRAGADSGSFTAFGATFSGTKLA
jgi:hypothetical protein